MNPPSFQEKLISQFPAVKLLQNLGYHYLSPEEAVKARGGRTGAVLLERILAEQLRIQNAIRFRGRDYPFSEGNILAAVQGLRDVVDDGLLRTKPRKSTICYVWVVACNSPSRETPGAFNLNTSIGNIPKTTPFT